MESRAFEPALNRARAEAQIQQAARKRAELILLPEFFNIGYCYDARLREHAEPLDGPTAWWMRKWSHRTGCHIGGCIAERDANRLYDTFLLADPYGQLHFYRKRHPAFFENFYFQRGDDPGIIETELGSLGIMICWDMVQPHLQSELAGQIDLLLISAAWPDLTTGNIPLPIASHWMAYQIHQRPRGLAESLQTPVVFCNMAGTFRTRVPLSPIRYRSHFAGQSAVIEADGFDVTRLEKQDAVLLADVDVPRRIRRAA